MDQYGLDQAGQQSGFAYSEFSHGQGQNYPGSSQARPFQRQQSRSTAQRSSLPSQQRTVAQSHLGQIPGHPDRQQPLKKMQAPEHEPQWPLRDDNARSSIPSNKRGPPPPRPPRPGQAQVNLSKPQPASNRVPTSLSIPQYRPDHVLAPRQHAQHDTRAWQDDDYGTNTYPTPDLSRPLTTFSRASTSSNLSASEFPVVQTPRQAAQDQTQPRRPPLGPPASARRGPSSYYPQISQVAPIVEESDSVYSQSTRAHHESYASSNAIPIGISDFCIDEQDAPLTDDESPFEDGREEEEEDSPVGEVQRVKSVPMRQASVGRRSRPTLTTIKSNDSIRPDSQTRPLSTKTMDDPSASSESMNEKTTESASVVFAPDPTARAAKHEHLQQPLDQAYTNADGENLDTAIGTLDLSYESEKSLRQKRSQELLAAAREQVRTQHPLAQAMSGAEAGHDSFEKSALPSLSEKLAASEKKGSLAQRVGSKRPPRLNVDVVKEAEARGSLTSLPDLIARATRLASNLDRGRTASRLGMDRFGDEGRRSQTPVERRKSGTSLSDILASFPPPGIATPSGSRGSRGMAGWPSHLRHSALGSDSDASEQQTRKRRCCGMPLWLFLLLVLLILLVVAAAVVVPVVLVVLPRQNFSSNASAKALATCRNNLSCENGGTNIVGTDGSCSCLCVNNYIGSHCTVKTTSGCTTTNFDGMSGVTVGEAIAPLLVSAQKDFNVPLNSSLILGMFSSNKLSCAAENALVTFNGLSSRSVSSGSDERDQRRPTPTLQKRQDATSETLPAATSNGIVFDSTPTSSSSLIAASATPSTSASASSNTTIFDFARVAVLFVMQHSGRLDNAEAAQENLQDYFMSGTTSMGQTIDATNITLADGYTANLQAHTITTAGGSSVGG